jgi:hypothetical protein
LEKDRAAAYRIDNDAFMAEARALLTRMTRATPRAPAPRKYRFGSSPAPFTLRGALNQSARVFTHVRRETGKE